MNLIAWKLQSGYQIESVLRRRCRAAGCDLLSALSDDAMEQPVRFGHRHQRRRLGAAAGLSENCDVVWIAAKLSDVVAHPLQREHKVEHAGVAGIGKLS